MRQSTMADTILVHGSFPFLKLPLELRDEVLEQYITTCCTNEILDYSPYYYCSRLAPPHLHLGVPMSRFWRFEEEHLPCLLVCREIKERYEALLGLLSTRHYKRRYVWTIHNMPTRLPWSLQQSVIDVRPSFDVEMRRNQNANATYRLMINSKPALQVCSNMKSTHLAAG
jgi:hypothetical protein